MANSFDSLSVSLPQNKKCAFAMRPVFTMDRAQIAGVCTLHNRVGMREFWLFPLLGRNLSIANAGTLERRLFVADTESTSEMNWGPGFLNGVC